MGRQKWHVGELTLPAGGCPETPLLTAPAKRKRDPLFLLEAHTSNRRELQFVGRSAVGRLVVTPGTTLLESIVVPHCFPFCKLRDILFHFHDCVHTVVPRRTTRLEHSR